MVSRDGTGERAGGRARLDADPSFSPGGAKHGFEIRLSRYRKPLR